MKKSMMIIFLCLSFMAKAQNAVPSSTPTPSPVQKIKKLKKKPAKELAVQVTSTPAPKASAAPCESKEDILKKIEEEKQKQKPFSLQGGNTGCSVDKK